MSFINKIALRLPFFLIIVSFLASCAATVNVKPEVSTVTASKPVVVRGRVVYEGNPFYLPATVGNEPASDLTIAYDYAVSYDGTGSMEMLMGLIPTTILGTPTGKDDVVAAAKMVISKGDRVVKSYVSEATVSKPRSLFAGGVDKTELRRLALMGVKENIETQMKNDAASLEQINR